MFALSYSYIIRMCHSLVLMMYKSCQYQSDDINAISDNIHFDVHYKFVKVCHLEWYFLIVILSHHLLLKVYYKEPGYQSIENVINHISCELLVHNLMDHLSHQNQHPYHQQGFNMYVYDFEKLLLSTGLFVSLPSWTYLKD